MFFWFNCERIIVQAYQIYLTLCAVIMSSIDRLIHNCCRPICCHQLFTARCVTARFCCWKWKIETFLWSLLTRYSYASRRLWHSCRPPVVYLSSSVTDVPWLTGRSWEKLFKRIFSQVS